MSHELTAREALNISASMMVGLSLIGPWGLAAGYIAGEFINGVIRKIRTRSV
jgi:F0F1-type ATP synthase membrane subunit c/vacuolar-type H+-ATPase subunit K